MRHMKSAPQRLDPGAKVQPHTLADLLAWHSPDSPDNLSHMGNDATRHRLLEGVLLRLARRPDAAEFILRGGLLMRHWFRPVDRPADDVDLVATFPFDFAEGKRRFHPILADTSVADGVTFDARRARFEEIWLGEGIPVIRVHVWGMFEGVEAYFHVDITFGPFPRPAPVYGELPTASGEVARVRMCRPESVAGHKVAALRHLNMLNWRPKDLNDLRLLLDRVPMSDAALTESIAAYLGDLGCTGADARGLFAPSMWGMKRSAARWQDFVRSTPGQGVPSNLQEVVADIARRLAPVLERVP